MKIPWRELITKRMLPGRDTETNLENELEEVRNIYKYTLTHGSDGTYLILITGTLNCVIADLLQNPPGSHFYHYGVESLLCLGEVGFVSSCGV